MPVFEETASLSVLHPENTDPAISRAVSPDAIVELNSTFVLAGSIATAELEEILLNGGEQGEILSVALDAYQTYFVPLIKQYTLINNYLDDEEDYQITVRIPEIDPSTWTIEFDDIVYPYLAYTGETFPIVIDVIERFVSVTIDLSAQSDGPLSFDIPVVFTEPDQEVLLGDPGISDEDALYELSYFFESIGLDDILSFPQTYEVDLTDQGVPGGSFRVVAVGSEIAAWGAVANGIPSGSEVIATIPVLSDKVNVNFNISTSY
ncbi:MAG: hypothetical protein LIP08_05980 [Bacteroides sp.]|nr:hypothetical protein [Bacteroides sp.]